MLWRLREHFGSAGLVVAIIALVAALAGGAVAATGGQGEGKAAAAKGKQGPRGKTGKTGPQGPAGPAGPQGPKGVAGAVGPQGERGPIGPAGQNGKPGKAGEEGEEGSPWTLGGTLPGGETETGTFSYYDTGAERELNEEDYPGLVLPRLETLLPVSFPIPLAAPLAEADVHVAPNENCPGTAADPRAATGHFCVYVGGDEEGTGIAGVYPPDVPINVQGAATAGAMLYVFGGKGIWGTWAVTAP